MLSNTAVPKYYGEFRDQVMRGEIPVCEEISMEMNRIDMLIDNPGVYYDPDPVECYIMYCNNELTLTDGSPLELLPTFKLWAEEVYGWYYFVDRQVYNPETKSYRRKRIKKRLTRKQFLIVARGASKSVYLSTNQGHALNCVLRTTHQVTTAPTMRQAEEVLSPLRTAMTVSRGPLLKFLTQGSIQNTTGSKANRVKLASTKKGIENLLTGSLLEVRAMAIDKLQGLRPYVSTVDEWLSGDTREDVIGAIEQGASKMDEYLIIAASSEGTTRGGVGDEVKLELLKILKGEYVNPHVSIFYYRMNDIKDIADPEKWVMTQPNIGITVTHEVYQLDVERAEQSPASRNDILAKRFGIPMEGHTYMFKYEDTLLHPRKIFDKLPCSLGMDASRGDDFCAFEALFPLPRGQYGIKALSFISQRTYDNLPETMRYKYDMFIEEGSLIVLPGSILDMEDVFDEVVRWLDVNQYDVICLGYDPYNAKEFIQMWEREFGPFGLEKVIQGARTESVPLGEIQKLASDRCLIFDQEIMKFTMGNAIQSVDPNGNRK